MKIMVTGVSGFIGSHIINYFNHWNGKYLVTGCSRSGLKNGEFKCVKCDLSQTYPDIETDVMIHTAGLTPEKHHTFYEYFHNNVTATRNILQYASENSVKKIIYLGSVSSYGTVDQILREDSPHNNPGSYGLTKFVAEQLIRDSGIPYDILILPGVTGRGCGNSWIMKTAAALYKNEDVTYYNGHGLFNNLVTVEDICAFIHLLIEQRLGESETYLLGADELITVESAVLELKKNLSSSSKVHSGVTDSRPFYLDVSRALKAGFSPKPMAEMLREVCREVRFCYGKNQGNKILKTV